MVALRLTRRHDARWLFRLGRRVGGRPRHRFTLCAFDHRASHRSSEEDCADERSHHRWRYDGGGGLAFVLACQRLADKSSSRIRELSDQAPFATLYPSTLTLTQCFALPDISIFFHLFQSHAPRLCAATFMSRVLPQHLPIPVIVSISLRTPCRLVHVLLFCLVTCRPRSIFDVASVLVALMQCARIAYRAFFYDLRLALLRRTRIRAG